jgi:hypothetical protein
MQDWRLAGVASWDAVRTGTRPAAPTHNAASDTRCRPSTAGHASDRLFWLDPGWGGAARPGQDREG